MTIAINDFDIAALISQARGDKAAALNTLLGEQDTQRSTVATRKQAQRRVIEEFDLDRLIDLQDKMTRIIDVITKNELGSQGGVLTGAQAADLMGEFLDERDVAELLEVRRQMIKEAVFSHLDTLAAADGHADPANTNGAVEVTEHGKKFCREGTGYGTPEVDEQRLQALLGDRWVQACDEEVVPEQHIPAHIEYKLSLEKVLDLANRDPQVLEHLRTCLIPGKRKSPRFAVRDL